MRKKRKENKIKNFFKNPKTVMVLCFLILFFLSFPLIGKLKKEQQVNKEIKSLKEEISEIEGENRELDKLIEYLESDQFLEEQARLNLGLKKEGEEVLVIKEGREEGRVAGISENGEESGKAETKTEVSNPIKWWRYFFE